MNLQEIYKYLKEIQEQLGSGIEITIRADAECLRITAHSYRLNYSLQYEFSEIQLKHGYADNFKDEFADRFKYEIEHLKEKTDGH